MDCIKKKCTFAADLVFRTILRTIKLSNVLWHTKIAVAIFLDIRFTTATLLGAHFQGKVSETSFVRRGTACWKCRRGNLNIR